MHPPPPSACPTRLRVCAPCSLWRKITSPSSVFNYRIRSAAAAALALAAIFPATRAAEDREAPIELPPLEVVADATAVAKPWLYAAFPGGEVLSRSSYAVTREFLEGQYRLQQVIATVIPESLQGRRSVPDYLILTPRGDGRNLSKDLVARANETAAAGDPLPRVDPITGDSVGNRIRIFDNLRITDTDSAIVYAVLDEYSFGGMTLQFTPDQLRFLLESRVPRLPEWFIAGVEELFRESRVDTDTLIFGSARWLPLEDATKIISSSDFPPPLLAMYDLFEKPCPPAQGATLVAAQRWRSQAALFVRWMMENESRRARLWRFAARAAEVPVTDDLCQQLTGLDYVDLRERLSDYVRPALLRDGFRVKAPKLSRLPTVELREASPREVARIKGDWERLEVNWVRARQPRFINSYISQARGTLKPVYDRGERDPAFLAVLGLLECDLGNDDAALPLLEAAVAARVARPRAYYELARIRYAAAKKDPKGGTNLLDAAQANGVLEPFKFGFDQTPPLLEACRLITNVWGHSTATLGPAQFAICDRALRAFPRDPALLYNIAALKVMHGLPADATALLERGLATTDSPVIKARFEKMLASLTAPTP